MNFCTFLITLFALKLQRLQPLFLEDIIYDYALCTLPNYHEYFGIYDRRPINIVDIARPQFERPWEPGSNLQQSPREGFIRIHETSFKQIDEKRLTRDTNLHQSLQRAQKATIGLKAPAYTTMISTQIRNPTCTRIFWSNPNSPIRIRIFERVPITGRITGFIVLPISPLREETRHSAYSVRAV